MTIEREPAPGLPERPAPALVAIIEDNADIAGLYAALIEARGMRACYLARDGAEAVEAFRRAEKRPDLILIDHRMPAMSGLAAMKEILAIDPAARFVFISADEDIRNEAIAAGARAFLRKPATVKDILDAVKNTLDGAGH
ncbi:MAG: acetoacetate metabolism regulatory protein AtoC [Methanocella sp. PtaU1.Bin125]|nr:MAG: acetoacetate metabolism regulatory protein AtoC [Methanocella sp. PtaU1.Bin125]